jgi:hypothetical protein
MTTKLLQISTTQLKTIDPTIKTHDFSITIPNLILNNDRKYSVALVNYSLWYSWFNVSASNSNNQIKYSPDNGVTFYTLTIPSGNYGIDTLSSVIQSLITDNGHDGTKITLTANYSTLKVELVLTNNYQLDLTISNTIDVLIGFNKLLYTASQSGTLVPNITNSIDLISINCDLVSANDNFINEKNNDSLFSFVPSVAPGSNINGGSGLSQPVYLPISRSGYIGSIHFSVRSNNGLLLDLNGENVSLTLVIRDDGFDK